MIEVVDFYANWCGPCKALAPVLEKVAAEKSINVNKVNIEEDVDDLSLKYGVRNIPTVIALKDGNELARFVGAKSEGELNKFFDGLVS